MALKNCVIFDLDNTLASTNKLKEIRETQNYDALTPELLSKIKLYRPVLALLKSLQRQGIAMGVVTNSGAKYVSTLLAHLEIKEFFAAVVTYSDVKAIGMKPSPAGIKMVLEKMDITPSTRVLYVGDASIDVEAAYNAGVTPIVPTWASRESLSMAPALELSSKELGNYFQDPGEYVLFAERCADGNSEKFARKAVRFLPLDGQGNVVTMETEMTTFCLGRYYGQKSPVTATLHDGHVLSRSIASKNDMPVFEIPPYWFGMIDHVVRKGAEFVFDDKTKFDVVTVVPKKAGKDDRMERLLVGVKKHNGDNDIEFIADLFHYLPDAKSQKTLNRNERFLEANRSLQLTKGQARNIAGRRVLIIDDVITTGATMERARTLALAAGATSAIGVAIAKTVSVVAQEKECSACGRAMVLQRNSGTGERFWGCLGYKDEESPCKHTEALYSKECAKCGRPMRIRTNSFKKTKFWGCTGYHATPQCSYSENFDPNQLS
jgi:HAD superfamily hydrolase (TIGR01662 family)